MFTFSHVHLLIRNSDSKLEKALVHVQGGHIYLCLVFFSLRGVSHPLSLTHLGNSDC